VLHGIVSILDDDMIGICGGTGTDPRLEHLQNKKNEKKKCEWASIQLGQLSTSSEKLA
jgi:hypothetical protein